MIGYNIVLPILEITNCKNLLLVLIIIGTTAESALSTERIKHNFDTIQGKSWIRTVLKSPIEPKRLRSDARNSNNFDKNPKKDTTLSKKEQRLTIEKTARKFTWRLCGL